MELPFERWVDYVFNRPVAADGEDPWFYQAQEDFPLDYLNTIHCSSMLFRELKTGWRNFTSGQIEQGLIYVQSFTDLQFALWDKETPLKPRQECIRSMRHLYPNLFRCDPLGHVCYMWWDALRVFSKEFEEEIRVTMEETIKGLFTMTEPHCLQSAIHGLAHLGGSDANEFLLEFQRTHPDLDEDTKDVLEQALSGDML